MKNILRIEELFQFILFYVVFLNTGFSQWIFWGLLLAPDISMIAYAAGPRIGAFVYNLFHHKAVALCLYFAGINFFSPVLLVAGIILYAHSSMDRIFGYGLKFSDAFTNTHLGKIGKQ